MKNGKQKKIVLILSVLYIIVIVGFGILLHFLFTQKAENTVLLNQNKEQAQTIKNMEEENQKLQSKVNSLSSQVDDLTKKNETLSFSDLPEAGTLIEEGSVDPNLYFQKSGIQKGDAVYQRIIGKSYRENPDVALADLNYLKVLHYNFDHKIQVGELIVNASISDEVLLIFKELFQNEYEIQSMYLIDNYWTGDGDSTDTASIDQNNTSAFNYREITGGGKLSNHAYGLAIDINPQQNPYVWLENGEKHWTHTNADRYIDRESNDPHVIQLNDLCYNTFTAHGFSWGGNWSNPIDYQHFEKS